MATVDLSKGDFDEKIKNGVVLVDFWAEWCVAPESQVAVSRRESVAAEKIVAGKNILAMGEGGVVGDRVERIGVVADGGHCKRVTTEAGRMIETTDDHLFYTGVGWKKSEDLVKGDRVAVLPMLEAMDAGVKEDLELVGQKNSGEIGERYVRELEEMGLIPLKLTSDKLPIVARIAGAVFSDGNLYLGKSNNYREISFALGSRIDVEELTADLRELGIEKVHVKERQTKNEIRGREFVAHTFKVKVLSTALWRLLVALGVPAGRKTDAEYDLPWWLSRASKLAQREFLAAYLGGDGPKVEIRLVEREKKLPYNGININDLEFHKNERLAKSGLVLAKSLAGLLENFGVRVAKVFCEDEGVVWKNGRRSVILHIRFKHDVETAFALTRRIGYVYCRQKQAAAEAAGEFLARIRRRRERWQANYAMAVEWAKTGTGVKEIAEKLGIGVGTVWGWVKMSKKATTNYYKEKFRNWVVGAGIGLADGLMWDVVEGVGEVFSPKVARIAVAANHNFIANGFVVHNCGPCKMSAPVLEQMSDEYAGKVTIAKVDVDRETDLAARFGVMSIPTVVLFNNGVEAGRQVGFAGRQGYVNLLAKAGV